MSASKIQMPSLNYRQRWLAAGLVVVMVLATVWIWRRCSRADDIPFLPAPNSSTWIIYPKPPGTTMHPAARISATFTRSFRLAAVPTRAKLSVRAFTQGLISLNGRRVDELTLTGSDWKRVRSMDAASFLQAGTNEISVTISNSFGPPAFWCLLESDQGELRSDRDWEASLLGAAWQRAVPAEASLPIRPGNHLFGSERMAESLRKTWPTVLVLLLIATGITATAFKFLGRTNPADPAPIRAWPLGEKIKKMLRLHDDADQGESRLPWVVLGLAILMWVALFCNNLPQLASLLGFDRDGHVQYIDYILQKNALPLADEGWQMYQPPLYYLLSAATLWPFAVPASADSALLGLRALSALIGVAHLVLIFLSLRCLFPAQPSRQIAGLLLAAFLPAHLCLTHHITNENLGALLVTAALYLCLRSLRPGTCFRGVHVALGACLGLAMLAKFSALLAIPFVLGAVVWHSQASPQPGRGAKAGINLALFRAGMVVVSMVAVCGWHYARVWARFGNPLIGNWDHRLPFAWWQEPGFHTAAWYRRFGETFVSPLFSSVSGFLDGIYSSLWGDGLCSGSARLDFRPQWNYDLMNAGYLLSLFISAVLFIGVVKVALRFLRRPTAEWFLLAGLISAFAAGIVFMTLRVPSYAQVKALYSLPALLPLCAIVALGWDFLVARLPWARSLLWGGMATWALTAYASFWIQSEDAYTPTAQGISLAADQRYNEAATKFSRALQLDPAALGAGVGLTDALNRTGQYADARKQAALTLQQHPEAPEALIQAAITMTIDNHYEEAVGYLRQAISHAPDHPAAYEQLAFCLNALHRPREVVAVCVEGLRVNPFSAELHNSLAAAAREIGDATNAATHLGYASELNR